MEMCLFCLWGSIGSLAGHLRAFLSFFILLGSTLVSYISFHFFFSRDDTQYTIEERRAVFSRSSFLFFFLFPLVKSKIANKAPYIRF